MTEKNIRFYFDMDGVLAKWRNVSIEETYQKGYFAKLTPEFCIVDAVRAIYDMGYDVSILSAVYQDGHSVNDKISWLKENGLGGIPGIFVPYGEKKADYLKKSPGSISVLVDDFSKNLREWVDTGDNFIGIKFMNGINGTKGTWAGYLVSNKMSSAQLVNAITGIAKAEAAA